MSELTKQITQPVYKRHFSEMEFEETLSPTQKIEKGNIFKPRFACLQCKLNFKRSDTLLCHSRRVHTQFQCDFCPKHFVNKNLVRLHLKTHQKCAGSLKILNNSCPICGNLVANLDVEVI